MLALLIALVGLAAGQNPTYAPMCYDPRLMTATQQKCYTDQGLVLHVAANPYNPDHQKEATKNNAMTSSPDYVCQHKAAYDAAIHCSLEASRKCTMPAYMTLLPSEDNLKSIQNLMCNNLALIDHGCVVNNTDSLFDCGSKKYGTITINDANDPFKATCIGYAHAEECLEEEIQECGTSTLDLQKQFNRLQAPIACQDEGVGGVGK